MPSCNAEKHTGWKRYGDTPTAELPGSDDWIVILVRSNEDRGPWPTVARLLRTDDDQRTGSWTSIHITKAATEDDLFYVVPRPEGLSREREVERERRVYGVPSGTGGT